MNRRRFLRFLSAAAGGLAGAGARLVRPGLLAAGRLFDRRGLGSPGSAGLVARSAGAPRAPDAFVPPVSRRQDIDLSAGWRFLRADAPGAETVDFDDSGWTSIDLPHTWNNLDGQQHMDYYRGIGWYRRHYAVDPALAGMSVFLQLDGANTVTDAFVNGTFVGTHKGGHARFRFDVTGAIRAGADNVIAIRVNNARDADVPPLDADFTFFGGLYRPVHLLVTDPVHVQTLDFGSSGVFVTPRNVSAASADIDVRADVLNTSEVVKIVTATVSIVDGEGALVTSLSAAQDIGPGADSNFSFSTTLANPRLWRGRADPYMYKAHVAVSEGSGGSTAPGARAVGSTIAGLRVDGSGTDSADDGTVNDLVSQPFGLRFFSIDRDNGFSLNGSYLDLHGVNRHQDRLDKGWALSPADHEEDFGLIQEIGATAVRLAHYQHDQYVYDLADRAGLLVWAEIPLVDEITESPAFYANARQQLLELIRQNYHHPSIFCWSISNEITLGAGPDPNALLQMLADLVASEDPSRLSTLAAAADPDDPTTQHTNLVGFNRYAGWYYGSYDDAARQADDLHADCPRPIAMSEYGAGSSIRFHSDVPVRLDHTEEYQNLFHEAYWLAMKSRSYLWGKFVWNMFDFASAERDEGDTPGRNDKGLVTYDRQTRKDAFFWYKANWSADPVVYVASRRFTPRTRAVTDVKVYSNAEVVEVRLNGTSLGSQDGPDRLFIWRGAVLSPGNNLVEAIATFAREVYRDAITWTLTAD